MRLNEIRDNPGSSKRGQRVGRGIGSGRGKRSGRGQKGQKSRSGVSLQGFEGGQMPLYRRLPKRGFKNLFRKQYVELDVGALQRAIDKGRIDAGHPLTEDDIGKARLIKRLKDGVSLLAKGTITSAIRIEVTRASKGAIAAVEKAGGSVMVTGPVRGRRPTDSNAAETPDTPPTNAPAEDGGDKAGDQG